MKNVDDFTSGDIYVIEKDILEEISEKLWNKLLHS